MRFICLECGEKMDESLVDQTELKRFKRGETPFSGIPCPFCKKKNSLMEAKQ